MIYVDLPKRDLRETMRAIEGLGDAVEVERIAHLGTAADATQAVPREAERRAVLVRTGDAAARAAWLATELAPLGERVVVAGGLLFGFRTWVAVAAPPGGGWLDTLLAAKVALALVARADGSAAIQVRRQAFTDGTVELTVWRMLDAADLAPAWHAAARARVEAAEAQAWADTTTVLDAAGLTWRRVDDAPASPSALHRTLARIFDTAPDDHALCSRTASAPQRAAWLEAAVARLGAGPYLLAVALSVPGWVEIEGAPGWLPRLFGASVPARSALASGWSHTLCNLVIIGADRARAVAIGESEHELQAVWLDLPR